VVACFDGEGGEWRGRPARAARRAPRVGLASPASPPEAAPPAPTATLPLHQACPAYVVWWVASTRHALHLRCGRRDQKKAGHWTRRRRASPLPSPCLHSHAPRPHSLPPHPPPPSTQADLRVTVDTPSSLCGDGDGGEFCVLFVSLVGARAADAHAPRWPARLSPRTRLSACLPPRPGATCLRPATRPRSDEIITALPVQTRFRKARKPPSNA
jgi:hypothetical protein